MDSKCVEGPSLERLYKGHRGEVTGLSFNPDSTQLVSSSSDASLILWTFKKNTRAIKFEKHSEGVTGVHFARTGTLMVSCSKDKSVCLWKPSIRPRCRDFCAHTSAVRSVHMSRDSSTILSASNDKTVKLFMTEHQNRFLSSYQGHTNWVTCARLNLNGQLMVSCSDDKTVKLWDKLNNCCIHTFQEQNGKPNHVEFHPNDKCIGVGMSSNEIKIYDIRNYNLIQNYNAHTNSVNQLSFDPRGLFMISASSDSTAKVFDLLEGQVTYTLEGHDGPVTSVAFSSDGEFFATGGADKQVLVWRTNVANEVLAKTLQSETSCKAKTEVLTEGRSARTVDARLSFAGMDQPDVEVSGTQTIDLDSSNDVEILEDLEDNLSSSNLNSEESDPQAGGDNRDHMDEMLTQVRSLMVALKQDVMRMKNELSNVMTSVEKLEDVLAVINN